MRHRAIDLQIGVLGVYHNWPGFFALNALIAELAGFPGAQVYAGWAPVFFEILFSIGLLALFRLFTPDQRMQWLGVWLFLLTNWIGQDYFSPQAMGFVFLIGVLILVMQGFGPKVKLNLGTWNRRLSLSRGYSRQLRTLVERLSRLSLPEIPQEQPLTKTSRLALGVVVLLICGVIVSSHQLTPFIGVLATLVLALFGFSRWRTLPLWIGILMVLWLVFPAQAYNREIMDLILESFLALTENIGSSFISVAEVSPGQAVVAWMGRGLCTTIGLLAGIGIFQRARKGHFDLPVILLAASPLPILLLSAYGGEVLFRVYFFALPYLSFLAAGAILSWEKPGRNWLQTISVGGLSLILLVGLLFAYYGKEQQYYFTQGEVEAAEYLYRNAIPNSLLVEGSRNYPSQFLNYEYFTYVPIDREPPAVVNRLLAYPVEVLDDWLSNPDYDASYLIITRSMKAYEDAVGVMPDGSLDVLQDQLSKSNRFEVVYSNQDAIIFTKGDGE